MNLLRVQDALKNASDQQLISMMQTPDSTAPSYLVLSELRRRKEMRQKQEVEGGNERTVAEDLTAPQEPVGIRALQAPMDPDGADAAQGGDIQAMSGGGVANVRHYADGGVVRMQAGGQAPSLLTGLPRTTLQAMLDGGIPIPRGMTRLDVMNAMYGRQSAMEAPGPGGVGVAAPPPPPGGSNLRGAANAFGEAAGAAASAFAERPGMSGSQANIPRNIGRAPLASLPPLEGVEAQAAENERNAMLPQVMSEQERAARSAESLSGLAVRSRELAIRDIRGRINNGEPPDSAIRNALRRYSGVTEQEMRQALGIPSQPDAGSPVRDGQPPSRPLSEMSAAEVRSYIAGRSAGAGYSPQEARLELFRRGIDPAFLTQFPENRQAGYAGPGDGAVDDGGATQAAPPVSRQGQPGSVDVLSGRMEEDVTARLPPAGSPELAGPGTADRAAPPATRPAALPPQGAVGGEGQPAAASAEPAAGIRGLSGAGGGAGVARGAGAGEGAGGGLPTLAEVYNRNAALFPDNMGDIRNRIREGQVDPKARRDEAINMALIEAGLRIAGSRNPSLIGAIGEGALPAVQSYRQQTGQIRAEQRQALRDELEVAKQEVNRQYAIGQISSAEYRTRMEIISREMQAARAEAAADRRAGRSEAAADRRESARAAREREEAIRRGNLTPDEFLAMTPQQREAFREIRSVGRPADVSGVAQALTATGREIDTLRQQISELGPRPSETRGMFGRENPEHGRWTQATADLQRRLQAAEERRRRLEETLYYGRSGVQNQPPATTGAMQLPSGGRIENGRYIPPGG